MMQSLWNEIVTGDLSVCVRDTHTDKIVGKNCILYHFELLKGTQFPFRQ